MANRATKLGREDIEWAEAYIPCTQQKDSDSCGVFVLMVSSMGS